MLMRLYIHLNVCKMNPKSFVSGMDIIKNEEILLDPYTGSNYIDFISQASSTVIQDVAAAVGIDAIK